MPVEPSQPSSRPRSASRPRVLLWLFALTCLLRFPVLFSHPFCIDESYYAAGAVELNAGGAFYRDVVDHKAPGIYFIYALIYRIAGAYNQTAVHAVLLVVAALTAYVVGLLAQEFFSGRVGRWAGVLYAVASVIGPANDFQAANTELFTNLPLAAAFWLCARLWVRRRAANMETLAGFPCPKLLHPPCRRARFARPRAMVRAERSSAASHAIHIEASAMGLLVGLAVLIRPQAAWALLPIGITLWRRRAGLAVGATVAFAAAVPSLALLVSLWRVDAIADLRASLAYAAYYTRCLPFEVKLANASLKTLFFLAIDVGLVIPVVMLLVRGRRGDRAWADGAGCLLTTWLLASFVAVSAGGRFYPHYFIQLLPPLAVMAARQLSLWRREEAR